MKPVILSVLALSLAACAEPQDTAQVSWPTETWQISSPSAEGLSDDAVEAYLAELEAGTHGPLDRFLLIRHGRLVADSRFEVDWTKRIPPEVSTADVVINFEQYDYDDPAHHPYFGDTDLHSLQSVTKSVTSAAIGTAILAGKLDGLDAPIAPYLQSYDYGANDPRWQDITLGDLLTMRSGIAWETEGGYGTGLHSTDVLENSTQWVPYILSRSIDAEPGSTFEYNDGVSVLLGQILAGATGMTAEQWIAENLFAPIGIEDYHWKTTSAGELDTQGGLYLRSEDLARIGYLFLRKGQWDGETIVPPEWVQASTQPIVENLGEGADGSPIHFGLHWWVRSVDEGRIEAFEANGYGGQRLIVIPDLDVVAVFNAWDIHGDHAGPAVGAFYAQVASMVDDQAP